MKNIVLAAGYATRMYPLTLDFPKSLLKIGESTILDKMLADIDSIDLIDEHIIVTNHKFIQHFYQWKNNSSYRKPVTIIDDGSSDNENRLGAVNDLLLVINKCNLNDDLLVVAADNLLHFSFQGFVDFFLQKQTSMIMCHYESELSALQRTGVIVMDNNNEVQQMQEKPHQPLSNWAVPPFYIYRKEDISLIKDCVKNDKMLDAPGNLVNLMLNKTIFHAWEMNGDLQDIGNLETYYRLNNKQ